MKKLLKALPLLVLSSIAMASYEEHFPTYFEYCTGTQWKLQSGEVGGSPGHGFTYIHGLCKDYRSSYPQVIPCSEVSKELKEKYPHEGVGISLDKNFSNVMWVAVPGRDFMLTGNKERKAISESDVVEHVKKVIDLKIFDEVISKSDKLKPLTPGTPEYIDAISRDTLGTDHAANWARELHCVKIPGTSDSLKEVTAFLNQSNNQYKTGPGYKWDKLSNNCVHLSVNQSHAMGMSKELKLDQKYLKMVLNMALPANGFLMYADLAVLAKMPSNKLLSKVLPEKGFYQAQVGSIMESHQAFPSGEVFKTDELGVLTAPRILKPLHLLATPRKYEKKYMTPANSELKANAEMWIERYESLIDDLKPSQKGTIVETYLTKQLELSKKIAAEE
jgi:hypothetical protein